MEAAVPESKRCFHFVGGGWNKPDRVTLVGASFFFPPFASSCTTMVQSSHVLLCSTCVLRQKKILLQCRVRVNTYVVTEIQVDHVTRWFLLLLLEFIYMWHDMKQFQTCEQCIGTIYFTWWKIPFAGHGPFSFYVAGTWAQNSEKKSSIHYFCHGARARARAQDKNRVCYGLSWRAASCFPWASCQVLRYQAESSHTHTCHWFVIWQIICYTSMLHTLLVNKIARWMDSLFIPSGFYEDSVKLKMDIFSIKQCMHTYS